MPTLEEITYEAGRAAIAEQAAFVDGIRQRTGMLLAAHALVASFLGGTTLREIGPDGATWVALSSLLGGLLVAVSILAPWPLSFSVDARRLYATYYAQAVEESDTGGLGWLASAAHDLQVMRERNEPSVRRMSRLSGMLALLVVVQTLGWLASLRLD